MVESINHGDQTTPLTVYRQPEDLIDQPGAPVANGDHLRYLTYIQDKSKTVNCCRTESII